MLMPFAVVYGVPKLHSPTSDTEPSPAEKSSVSRRLCTGSPATEPVSVTTVSSAVQPACSA